MTYLTRTVRSASAAALSLGLAFSSQAGWTQQTAQSPAPDYPPPPNFAGVAGTAAENARITAICGANRNAADGYAPAPAFPGQTKAPIVQSHQGYAVQEVARIDRPWGMAFLPDGKMLVSFRDGGMRIVSPDGTVSEPLANVPEMVQPRIGSGMYDVILDRGFARNRTIYFSYFTRSPGDEQPMGRIARARLSNDEKSLETVTILREGADIQPRRLVQAPDGMLLIMSAGDLADVGPAPQQLDSQAGKVLRINADGSIPKDNPFASTPGANPAVFARGFRDIHSAVINPATGELWVAENTPRGGDELNVIRAGKNYGLPVISYGRQNNGQMINGGKTVQAGMVQPLYYWNPSIAPSGMLIYTGDKFPDWKGDIFIGAMSGQQVTRLEMDGEKVVGEEKLLMDRCQRFKTIQQGPDGLIYLLTDEAPPKQNEILRLVPAPSPPAPKLVPTAAGPNPLPPAVMKLGGATFDRQCMGCHGHDGEGGVGPRIAGRTDLEIIEGAVRDGVGAMPALSDVLAEPEIEAVARFVSTLHP